MQAAKIKRKHSVLVLEGRGLERGSDEPKTTQLTREEAPKWDQALPAAAKTTQ